MEYRLIVMRHAKSDWNTDAPNDHARPLNKRGRRDSPRIANRLVELGWQPDHVVSSDAQRTIETLEYMQPHFPNSPTVEFLPSLYHAGIRELQDAVNALPDEHQTVLALGHNPGWQSCVHRLTGELEEVTTGNAALLTIQADSWAQAVHTEYAWQLIEILRPRTLVD